MTYRKKLIEVALPLDAINKEAAREKSIRHGHPSTLHLWWARRPLAACRAVLFASLVDDPGNDLPEKEAEAERRRLFAIIEELVQWENSNDERVLHAARTEIARSVARAAGADLPAGELTPVQVREALAQYAPPVLDPFCGGGSIPLEAQRLGLKAYASDLNPVAVLITKALIEIPPKFAGRPPVHPREDMELGVREWKGAAGLAEDVRYYGKWMRDEAEKRIGHLYPKGPNGETVIAWLWARTVKCPNPACNTKMPLVKSFWLSKKAANPAWIEPRTKIGEDVQFRVHIGRGSPPEPSKIGRGARFRCLTCKQSVEEGYIKAEGLNGRLGSQLMAIVTDGPQGRTYHGPIEAHVAVSERARPSWHPDAKIGDDRRSMFTPLYGITHFHQLFTPRQLTALSTLGGLIAEAHSLVRSHALAQGQDSIPASEYADAVATYLAFAIDKMADTNSTICTWQIDPPRLRATFGRAALPMTWDYAEANIFGDAAGDYKRCIGSVCEVLERLSVGLPALAIQLDAVAAHSTAAAPIISTDPPYYDNIGYADLSDYFYIWLRRSLGTVYPNLFSTLLVPKTQELVAATHRHEGSRDRAKSFFEEGLGQAFARMQTTQNDQYPTSVYYAFKQAESEGDDGDRVDRAVASTGWETMLEGLVGAGFTVNGTWPIRSELHTRNTGRDANALASSIVLVCRPRAETASLATRREFVAALKRELPSALTKLTHGGIAPVDLAQASIGPGMAVFSRYAKVLEADGTPMSVRTALQIINQQLDEYLAAEEGDLDRDTRFAVAWFQQFGHTDGAFGEADVLARAKDTAVEGLVRAGVLRSRAGKVRLLRRGELDADWDPRVDARLTVWECAQQLIRRLNETGEAGAARLLKQLGGGRGEDARALAYRLYAICERKGWAEEALAYNALVVSWPEIEKLAAGMEGEPEQGRLL